MTRPKLPGLPDVCDSDRRKAFALMRWKGWTFEQAMADDMKRRFIEARAAWVRTDRFLQQKAKPKQQQLHLVA